VTNPEFSAIVVMQSPTRKRELARDARILLPDEACS
jgi:hypothetical protein